MKSPKFASTLIVINIPKTGGSTLGSIINRQYPRSEIHSVDPNNVRKGIERFRNLPLAEREQIRVLRGHIGFGLHPYLKPPCVYLTFLRHPVDRVVSHYYYILRTPTHYLYEAVAEKGLTLQEYVKSSLTIELNNGQTRMLAGVDGIELSEPGIMSQALKIAKQNLREHFVIVGLTDKFDESLLLLSWRLGWKDVFYRKLNVSHHRPDVTEVPASTIEAIRVRNKLDLELYEFVQRLHHEEIARQGLEFKLRIRSFYIFNAFYNLFSIHRLRRRLDWDVV